MPEFSVELLSKELGMSRVYLYKKLIALTGKTPIEFILVNIISMVLATGISFKIL